MNCKQIILAMLSLCLVGSGALQAQGTAPSKHTVSLGASYTFERSNLLPGCQCFGMEGGSAEAAFNINPHLAVLGDITVTHRSGLSLDGYNLTQSVFSTGLRYALVRPGVQPFGDVLLGTAHAGGNLSPGRTGFGSSEAFAFQAGGGLLVPLGERWQVKPVQVNYLLTTFANGADDRQNDLRLSAGVAFRIKR